MVAGIGSGVRCGGFGGLNRVIARTYPYLETDMDRGKELAKKYPDILTKVKQLFFHKIGALPCHKQARLLYMPILR